MTRVNVVDPKVISTKQLIAEYNEIRRLPTNLRTSLNRKSKPFSMDEIPPEYVLGKGHVKFFFDKMLFLQKRYDLIVKELISRGIKINKPDSSFFSNVPKEFYNDYTPTQQAQLSNMLRINLRLQQASQRRRLKMESK